MAPSLTFSLWDEARRSHDAVAQGGLAQASLGLVLPVQDPPGVERHDRDVVLALFLGQPFFGFRFKKNGFGVQFRFPVPVSISISDFIANFFFFFSGSVSVPVSVSVHFVFGFGFVSVSF